MIYQAKVTRTDNNTHETYVGLTENDFTHRIIQKYNIQKLNGAQQIRLVIEGQ